MKHSYKTKGTCSSQIDFELENGIVKDIRFHGGCDGNTKGVSSLADGMSAKEVVSRCEGIRCGSKSTSCPDQLARALKEALQEESGDS